MNASRRQLAMLRSLRTRKGREETGLFLVEGVRLCSELLRAKARVEIVLVAEGRDKSGALGNQAAQLAAAGAEILQAPQGDFERVSDTVQSQGILAAVRWNNVAADALRFGEQAAVLALDGVSDPGNVGTVIRTAAWFGVSAAILGEGCADLLNPKTVRATMGGIFQLPICRNENLKNALTRLKGLGFRVTAATMDGQTDWRGWADSKSSSSSTFSSSNVRIELPRTRTRLTTTAEDEDDQSAASQSARLTRRSALILGSEARGVSDEICRLADQRVTIPRRGAGESLNVAVSAGILLSAL